MPIGTFQGEDVLMNLFVTFGRRSKSFRFLRNRLHQVCPNCLLRVHSNILKKKCLKFSDVGQKTIGILWQTFRQGCKNCFPGVHGNKLSRKTFRWKPYIFLFRHWAESFQFCPKVFWLGCQNCISPGERIILRSIPFEFLPHLFRTLSKKSPRFCGMFINWVVKTAFVVSIRAPQVVYFLEKGCRFLFITFGLSDKKYCFLTKIYRHVCQKCILTVHWNNLRRGFLWKTFLASFRALAKNSWFFLE